MKLLDTAESTILTHNVSRVAQEDKINTDSFCVFCEFQNHQSFFIMLGRRVRGEGVCSQQLNPIQWSSNTVWEDKKTKVLPPVKMKLNYNKWLRIDFYLILACVSFWNRLIYIGGAGKHFSWLTIIDELQTI